MQNIFIEYPKCSTCKKAKKWLEDNNIEFEDRNIVEHTPTIEELTKWIKRKDYLMKKRYIYNTIIGPIEIIEEDGYIINLGFNQNSNAEVQETVLIKETYKQITQYLQGNRKEFNIPIKMKGTDFQKSVWTELTKIPYGETRTYKQIAENVGNPKACRAVGMANHNNPIAIIVPCHRVIGANNKLVGYAGGLDIKGKLLEIEKS